MTTRVPRYVNPKYGGRSSMRRASYYDRYERKFKEIPSPSLQNKRSVSTEELVKSSSKETDKEKEKKQEQTPPPRNGKK